MDHPSDTLLCPSAQPDMAQARVIGIINGTPEVPQVAYLEPGVVVDVTLSSQLGALDPTHVFRFAATCETQRCTHFDGKRCSLAQRIVAQLPEVVNILPVCQIRRECRWYAEEGGNACRRCPQVITKVPKQDDALNHAAMP